MNDFPILLDADYTDDEGTFFFGGAFSITKIDGITPQEYEIKGKVKQVFEVICNGQTTVVLPKSEAHLEHIFENVYLVWKQFQRSLGNIQYAEDDGDLQANNDT